ncbi:MAG TPA: apolipoprotein N-acyltransferase, partial [Rhodospirillaceae bacterium]|nr:apolipoprotein N-acyltransferase [Rhodospirillaceae bacterium]
KEAFAPGVQLRLVQPNIAQADKRKPELKAGHVARQLEMSYAPPAAGAPAPTHIIWAETAAPYVMNRQPNLIRALAEAAPTKGALITGALRVTGGRPADALAYNSLYVVEASGRIADVYDKHHLVPFGEYVPFEAWLSWLKITVGRGNFSPGPGGRVMEVQGLPPVSPLICYEVIFPGAVVPEDGVEAGESRPRPRWLLNITNDAWFGVTPGPYQHFAAARLRAVEEGVALVRVANTGISAIVDPWGRVLERLDLDTSGTLDGGLPEPIGGRTFYSLWGNAGPLALSVLFLGLGGFLARRAGRSERP